MKLGDIKLEALKLMFTNYNEDIGIEQLQNLLGDEMYGNYLIAMTGSINRCFADLETRGVLPIKTFILPGGTLDEKGRSLKFNLKELILDFLTLERLVYETNSCKYDDEDIAFRTAGDSLLLPWFDGSTETYTVIYRPRIQRIFPYTSDETELDIPDYIAEFIPYWIKGELFRDDEPNEAGEARNWYESHMRQAEGHISRREGKVRTIYSQTEV